MIVSSFTLFQLAVEGNHDVCEKDLSEYVVQEWLTFTGRQT